MAQETTLHGWKAIAGYLGRDQRTALRWAAQRGLPVRRVPGGQRGPVFASTAEIDAWLQATMAEAAADVEPAVAASPSPADWTDAPAAALTAIPANAPRRQAWPLFLTLALLVGAACAAFASFLSHRVGSPSTRARTTYTDRIAKTAFLQATFDWNLRTRESLARAAREYGVAIVREPGVPDAYVGLANTYLLSRQYGAVPDAQAYARAAVAARAALALGPAGPDLHRALAFLAFWRAGDRATAKREFAMALSMRPDDALTHQWLANALSANGEPAAALKEIAVARTLDPTSTSAMMSQGILTYLAGDPAGGRATLRALESDQPQNATIHQLLGQIALIEGRAADFVGEEIATARLRGDAARLAAADRLRAAARAGPSVLKAALLERARRDAGRGAISWYGVAQAEAFAGHGDAAAAALKRSCDAGELSAVAARSDMMVARSLSPGAIDETCGRAESLL